METPKTDDKNVHGLEVVTSVGNSWVICRSRSYAGRHYYFNTLTGEAAWNLSDEDRAKAKTTHLERSHLENCPEPKLPPTETERKETERNQTTSNHYDDYLSPKIYNKQVIYNSSCSQCSHCNSLPVPSLSDSLLNPMALQSNQQQTETYNNTQPNTTLNQFMRYPQPNFRNKRGPYRHSAYKFGSRGYQNNFRPQQYVLKNKNLAFSNDLRKKLVKRTAEKVNVISHNNVTVNKDAPENANKNSTAQETDQGLFLDDQWLKEYGFYDQDKLRIDVTPLKLLANETELEKWYIVVDYYMVLDHYTILNAFINSDGQCRLLVPRDVLPKLQADAKADNVSLKERARRALRFLSLQFAAKSALIGETDSTEIIKIGLELVKQNHHVILLSDNEQLQVQLQIHYQRNIKLIVFTLNEIKDFLTKDSYRKSCLQERSEIEPVIKITIQNDQGHLSGKELCETTNKQRINDNVKPKHNKSVLPELTESNVQTESSWNTSKKVDTGVQTDFEFTEIPNIQKANIGVDTSQDTLDDITFENSSNKDTNTIQFQCSNPTMENIKKREVRLNRSTSCQVTQISENDGKRQFKWHRRKKIASCSDTETTVEKAQSLPKIQNIPNVGNELSYKSSKDNLYDDNIESSDTSSCIYVHKNINENVIIEETSTSDVISNTTSNVDTESLQESFKNYRKPSLTVNDENKNVMFEVTTHIMEMNLKMRCDEWRLTFLQIMEEVLTVFLQRERQRCHQNNEIPPPPWSLDEATNCIKQKFSAYTDIHDAATKLSQFLSKTGDKEGRLSVYLKPTEFMELYSYGVYLVDSLQDNFEEFSDLHAASVSLATLLSNIQCANDNDSFGEYPDEPSLVISDSIDEGKNIENTSQNTIPPANPNSLDNKELSQDRSQQDRKHNIRSPSTSPPEINKPVDVEFVRNIDVPVEFFDNLRMKKIYISNNTIPQQPVNNLSPIRDEDDERETNKGPVVIRNFSLCPQFEKRLKKNFKKPSQLYMHDYSDHGEDDLEEDTHDDYEEDPDPQISPNRPAEPQVDPNYYECVYFLVQRIKAATLGIHSFCEKTFTELNTTEMIANTKKDEILKNAQKARLRINSIRESLKGIYHREFIQRDPSVTRYVSFVRDENIVNKYRAMVSKWIQQGDNLLEAVDLIIDSVTSHPVHMP